MELYNKKTDKIADIGVINDNGIYYVDKLTDKHLNKLGYYRVEYDDRPNENFFDIEEVREVVKGICKVSYKKTKKSTAEIDAYKQNLKSIKLSRLEQIFTDKTTGLKKLAINKHWMTNKEAINDQYLVYEEMYKSAKKGYYDEATNKAIIQANEYTKKTLSRVTLLLNTIRSVLEAKIDDENIDMMLDEAENISLTKDDITLENLNEIKARFGL